jgi:choline dehydrogenase-like flavoprotein
VIRDGETLDDGGRSSADIAIVGAGPVGIAVALRLAGRAGRPCRIVMIEAGGTRFRPDDNLAYFRAESVNDPRHGPAEINRRRMLGGTSTVWGGRCIPFDPEDFAANALRPGWPIAFEEVDAYTEDAVDFLEAGRPIFDARSALPETPVLSAAATGDLVLDRIERYSKPTNLWSKWRAHLARSSEITVIHGATCTEILTGADGVRARALQLQTASGKRHELSAPRIVLACGGLETPRLMLASRSARASGLGNGRDVVGRFYMTHLVSNGENAGTLRFSQAATARDFDFLKTADGVYGRRMILLSPDARRREALPNIVFRPNRLPIDNVAHRDAVLSTMFLVRNLLIPAEYMRSLTARHGGSAKLRDVRFHLGNIAAGLPSLARFSVKWITRRTLARRKLPSVFLYREDGAYPLEFNAEQLPNWDSRVNLGTETDKLGMPRLAVHWCYQQAELNSICRAYRVLAASFAQSGLGEASLGADPASVVERALVPQGGHHIGTVRMGADASVSVVDPNNETWDCPGLFVAGTSVLPTSGFANPTLTAVTLALRLADRLARSAVA